MNLFWNYHLVLCEPLVPFLICNNITMVIHLFRRWIIFLFQSFTINEPFNTLSKFLNRLPPKSSGIKTFPGINLFSPFHIFLFSPYFSGSLWFHSVKLKILIYIFEGWKLKPFPYFIICPIQALWIFSRKLFNSFSQIVEIFAAWKFRVFWLGKIFFEFLL